MRLLEWAGGLGTVAFPRLPLDGYDTALWKARRVPPRRLALQRFPGKHGGEANRKDL